MESKIKIHSIGIILSIFAFAALIAIVEMPNMFENVLAQQLEGSQEDSSEGRDRIHDGERRSSQDRIHDGNPRSSGERYSQYNDEDIISRLR